MSDVSYTLQIPEARLESIERNNDAITLRFSQVRLVQVMENAFEVSPSGTTASPANCPSAPAKSAVATSPTISIPTGTTPRCRSTGAAMCAVR